MEYKFGAYGSTSNNTAVKFVSSNKINTSSKPVAVVNAMTLVK